MDHHAAQGRAHAQLHHVSAALARRTADAERGQGSVEYVALILLVGGVLAAAVAAVGDADLNLAQIISSKIKKAIEAVGAAG